MYMLGTPANDVGPECARDIPGDPFLRFQAWGPNTCAPANAVDDGSELRGLNYKSSKCSADQYVPGKYKAAACAVAGTGNPRACMAPTESTRISNGPCTLRGTGWNRWEWLCYDPQDKAIIPFEWNVSYRTVVKDNHAPILEEPMDQSMFVPSAGKDPAFNKPPSDPAQEWLKNIPAGCGASAPGNPFQASWRTEGEMKNM